MGFEREAAAPQFCKVIRAQDIFRMPVSERNTLRKSLIRLPVRIRANSRAIILCERSTLKRPADDTPIAARLTRS